MTRRASSRLAVASAAVATLALAAGCASAPSRPPAIPVPQDVPANLQPPAGQEPFLQVHATGVQVYECGAKADAPGGFAWIFKAPEASLAMPPPGPMPAPEPGPCGAGWLPPPHAQTNASAKSPTSNRRDVASSMTAPLLHRTSLTRIAGSAPRREWASQESVSTAE